MHISRDGFTLLELLLTVGIIAVIGAIAVPFLSNFMLRNATHSTHLMLLGQLRKAQQYAMHGKQNSVWGVCQTGSVLRLYRTSCASPTYSEEMEVPTGVTVSGLNDVIFSKMRGEPSAVLTVTISSVVTTRTIVVEGAGLISQQ